MSNDILYRPEPLIASFKTAVQGILPSGYGVLVDEEAITGNQVCLWAGTPRLGSLTMHGPTLAILSVNVVIIEDTSARVRATANLLRYRFGRTERGALRTDISAEGFKVHDIVTSDGEYQSRSSLRAWSEIYDIAYQPA